MWAGGIRTPEAVRRQIYGLPVLTTCLPTHLKFCGEWQIRTAVPGLTVRSLGPLDELPILRLVQDSNLRCCSHGTLTVCCLKPLGQPNIIIKPLPVRLIPSMDSSSNCTSPMTKLHSTSISSVSSDYVNLRKPS